LHVPQSGEHRVVWWDPSLFESGGYIEGRSKLTEFLKQDDTKHQSQSGILAHQQWQARRSAVREKSGEPGWNIVTATTRASMMVGGYEPHNRTDAELDVAVESVAIDFTRPHGKRFGTLVHTIMSVVPLDSRRNEIEAVAHLQGRILGTTDHETEAAIEIVSAALRQPLMQRAAAALTKGKCRREVPILLKLDGGTVVEGIVDLAFHAEQDPGWTVVDYKTDFELRGKLEEYRRQVALYVDAISRATGATAHGIILRL
jgi:ATP-dependent exoDNAse (exonuclease V) beta subunit